jgi:gliding motility-associated-like protein
VLPLYRAYVGLALTLLFCLACGLDLFAQTSQGSAYSMYGSTTQNSCNCFTLTPGASYQAGTVWNKVNLDLHQSFDYQFKINLGCINGDGGADGLAFALQSTDAGVGAYGMDLGLKGIQPSFAVTVDTYQNTEYGDPSYDHLAFQANGDMNHLDAANNLAGPVQALAGSSSIKDCNWHILEVKWEASDSTLSAYIDGSLRLSKQIDIVNRIFSGNSLVYWGLSAGTGGSYNIQQVCTVLQANPYINPAQEFCENHTIAIEDSTPNPGFMESYYWSFGDGTTSTLANPPPHLYPNPGTYLVIEAVEDSAGCTDTSKNNMIIGTYPVPKFSISSTCDSEFIPIQNLSTDSVGTISTWNWSLSNGTTYTDSIPNFTGLVPGNYRLTLSAISAQNCPSLQSYATSFSVYPIPTVAFQADTACAGTPVILTGASTNTVPITQWYWKVDSLPLQSGNTFQYTFASGGNYNAFLWALSPTGCSSDTVTQVIQIQQSYAYAGQDTLVALGYSIQLHATGGVSYLWSPAATLSNPDSADPIATPTDSTTYTVVAYTPLGCTSSASVVVKVFKGPAIYVPSAFTPNGDGVNDLLKVIAPGIRQLQYFRIFDRWGKQVYYSTQLQEGWDGTINGKPVPSGTYVWIIRGMTLQGNILSKQGTTVLIR